MLAKLSKQVIPNGHSTWEDKDEPEVIKEASMSEVCVAIIKLVVAPILYERKCKERKKSNGGKFLCHHCLELDPKKERCEFVQLVALKRHIWRHHTEWHDLQLKMVTDKKDQFKCPGVCGPTKLKNL
ncbi:hypothetical protein BDV93DRAFT_516429 [Ceratobasidium sp. AG-I]|nr:hypothetical protein BDV93DRAFT_516429 [Ceratobasidium sp. AG-I]